MIYVYDIILNWNDNDKVYEFFEWEINDELEHIKKIPLFKIESNLFDEIFQYEFAVDDLFLNKIYNLTESYSNEKIEYACLFTDGVRALAIEFDNKGNSIYRSRLLIDEEQDITILSSKLFNHDIQIQKSKKRNLDYSTTRLENEIRKILTIEIKDSYKKGNFDKLKYLYFECFGKEQNDTEVAYKKLLDSIDKEINYNHNKLYDVVKLSYQKKS